MTNSDNWNYKGIRNTLEKEGSFLREDQLKELIKVPSKERDQLFIFLLGYTGRRVSELLELRVKDIFFSDNTAGWNILKKGRPVYMEIPFIKFKTNGLEIINRLKEYVNKNNLGYDEYIFPSPVRNKKPLSRKWAYKWVRKWGIEIGYKDVKRKCLHPHTLRHTFAMLLSKKGYPMDAIKEFLQHSDIRVTEVYSKMNLTILKEVNKNFKV